MGRTKKPSGPCPYDIGVYLYEKVHLAIVKQNFVDISSGYFGFGLNGGWGLGSTFKPVLYSDSFVRQVAGVCQSMGVTVSIEGHEVRITDSDRAEYGRSHSAEILEWAKTNGIHAQIAAKKTAGSEA